MTARITTVVSMANQSLKAGNRTESSRYLHEVAQFIDSGITITSNEEVRKRSIEIIAAVNAMAGECARGHLPSIQQRFQATMVNYARNTLIPFCRGQRVEQVN